MSVFPPGNTRAPYLSIALLSAAALACEILLLRLFTIIQWHHFAYMIISLALLGFGASGAFLALARERLLAHFPAAYLANLALFGFAAVGCFFAAQAVPFNAEEVLWDARQPLRLFAIYLLLALPFFFAANGIGLALVRFRDRVSRLYGLDLFGAGIGSLGVVGLLFVVTPMQALVIAGALGVAAAVLGAWELRVPGRTWATMLLVTAYVPVAWYGISVEPVVSPYKGLSQTLRVTGTKIVAERSSPLGWIAVVESPVIPLRHAPGLSLNATREPPPQLALFTDGEALTAITRDTGERERLAYLDQMTSALPYHLLRPQRVLVLGAGGGAEVLQARFHGAPRIEAVELNPQVVELVRREYGAFAGGLYDATGVRVHVAEARGFAVRTTESFDLIQMALLDSFAAASAGLHALSESYLYTTEAFQAYLRRLAPGGLLAVTRWVQLPPRDSLRLFATAAAALRRSGATDPENRLILIRGWQTATLLVKNGAVTDGEIAALRRFARERSFDLAYYPGMPEHEANRYNVLERPYFYLGATALLGPGREDFLERYKFDLRPTTDDRPYFFHFFKWRVLPEILALRESGGMPLLEWGYLVLVATLAQALAASALFILLPLWWYRRRERERAEADVVVRTLAYFSAVGLAFLFLEIAFIQKFTLFLHHPLYAAATVIASFLVFAGLGSAWSARLAEAERHRQGVRLAVGGIAVLGTIYLFLLPPLFDLLMPWPTVFKVTAAALLVAPLAFLMGLPFPLALARLGETAPSLVPWAWGVNGCASVLSAVLATLLAVHFGFAAVVLLALALYGTAAVVFPR